MSSAEEKSSDDVRTVLEDAATRLGRVQMAFGGFVVLFGGFIGVVALKDPSISGSTAYLITASVCVLAMVGFGVALVYAGKTRPKHARDALDTIEAQPNLVTEAHFTRIQSKAAPGELGAVYNLQLTIAGKRHTYSIKHEYVALVSRWMQRHIPHALS